MIKVSHEIQGFLLKEAVTRFLEYVKIDTQSNESSNLYPSTEKQFNLGKLLAKELKELGFKNVNLDEFCFVYGDLPASKGYESIQSIGLIAHMDTSPSESGANVEPIVHKKFNGKPITFPKNKNLTISIEDSPELKMFIGNDIITASGDTLLGADDKAGIAAIIAAAAAWQKFPELIHGPITVCFTPDEEIGHGTTKINKDRLPKFCYTFDGGMMGELEIECFDAWKATINFTGASVHPGYAKNLMVNAIEIASKFVAELPEAEKPEHTEKREGFYHLYDMNGNCTNAKALFILRDFDKKNNEKRMDYLRKLKELYEIRYPGVIIDLKLDHSYENMLVYLEKYPDIIQKAADAIKEADLELKRTIIRGGTDGARLSAEGIPTPNIFSGALLFHSLKEYVPTIALQKGAEVILNLSKNWSKKK